MSKPRVMSKSVERRLAAQRGEKPGAMERLRLLVGYVARPAEPETDAQCYRAGVKDAIGTCIALAEEMAPFYEDSYYGGIASRALHDYAARLREVLNG